MIRLKCYFFYRTQGKFNKVLNIWSLSISLCLYISCYVFFFYNYTRVINRLWFVGVCRYWIGWCLYPTVGPWWRTSQKSRRKSNQHPGTDIICHGNQRRFHYHHVSNGFPCLRNRLKFQLCRDKKLLNIYR